MNWKEYTVKKGCDCVLRTGYKLLFFTFFQAILTIIAYEFYLRYALMSGGHSYSSVFSAIHPMIKIILAIELIISFRILFSKDGINLSEKWQEFSKV